MSRAKQSLSLIGALVCLLGLALSASAQDARRPTAPPVSAPRRPIAVHVDVHGRIRWRKELGMVPLYPGSNKPYPIPCGLFFVAALATVPVPGSIASRQTTVATTTGLPNKAGPVPEEGGYYVCTYTLTGLPINRNLTIMAGQGGTLLLPKVDSDSRYTKSPWLGGSQPAPPAGQERDFRAVRGGADVRLTSDRPTAEVDFEIVYVPSFKGPR
jgi:hypothetical protein